MRHLVGAALLGFATEHSPSIGADIGAPDLATETAITALDAAVDKWRQSLEFACTFTYRQGIADSEEDALAGRYRVMPDRRVDQDLATGTLCRLGHAMRFSLNFGGPPADASLSGDGSALTNVSLDAVVSEALALKYYPRYGSFGGLLRVQRRPDPERALLRPDPALQRYPNPFALGGGVDGAPLRSFVARPGYGERVEKSVAKPDASHVQVVMRRKGLELTQIRTITFRVDYDPPVIVEVREVSLDKQGNLQGRHSIVLSNFVKCGGGMLASLVREAGGPLQSRDHNARLFWVGKEWASADLGRRAVAPEDFAVRVPSGVHVRGLMAGLPQIQNRTINLLDLTEAHLDRSPLARDSLPLGDGTPTGRTMTLIVMAVGSLLVVVLVVGFRLIVARKYR